MCSESSFYLDVFQSGFRMKTALVVLVDERLRPEVCDLLATFDTIDHGYPSGASVRFEFEQADL